MPTPRRLFCLLALSCGFASCQNYAEYREVQVTGHTGDRLWDGLTEFATTRGLPVDPHETDLGHRVMQTKWRGGSRAFDRAHGRRRFRAELVALDKQLPTWLIKYYVEVETVPESTRNMRPQEDDWEFLRNDDQLERQFVGYLRSKFGTKAVHFGDVENSDNPR